MAFKDPTIREDEDTMGIKIRKKLNTIVGAEVNAKALEDLEEGDTVEVELDNVFRKCLIRRIYRTTARVYVPETDEQWRISGYYLHKVKPKDEIV